MAGKSVKPIPDGYHTVTPFLNVKGVAKLIDFLKSAFGAEEVMRMPGPDGTVMHAEVSIGNSRLMLGEPMQTGASTSAFYLYVSNVDAMYKRAIGAGAKSVSQPTDQFWGDRMATVSDSFGNTWSIATHKEDPTPEEMAKRMASMNQ
ncbi:MAG TPA: VOC family protein [Candidatus Binatus sp.]|jgi:PhnB protein|uniref:VOC family protein n=1 Tax=Candidatus Binatus sp. TaxID=2811406 RepID=UPI002F408ECF